MARYRDVLAALNDAGVSYVVVGGTAVVLQGHVRMTVDLDLVVELDGPHVRTALDVLLGRGLLPRLPVDPYDFADPVVRAQWRTERNLTVFSLYDPADPFVEIDLFADEPLPFGELADSATTVDVEGVAVPVASRPHLMAMKRAVGRPQDLLDVAALERLEDL